MREPADERVAGLIRSCSGVPARPQRGMAVVSVLLIVAIIAILAAGLMATQATAIHTAQSEQSRAQARWLLRGEVARAQAALYQEMRQTPSTRLDGLWNRPVVGRVVGQFDGGVAQVYSEITDEQSKFNLRNLVSGGQVDADEAESFLRLCALIGLPQDQAMRVARRVVLSLVEASRTDGQVAPRTPAQIEEEKRAQAAAEQLGIATLPTREQAPRLRTLDDLVAVPGIERGTVEGLRPYVTILPHRTRLNANTTRPEVLAATIPGLSLDRARALLQARDSGQWFLHRGDFINRLQMRDMVSSAQVRVGVTSRWYRYSGALRTPRHTLLMQALIHDDKQVLPQVVWLREGA